MIPFLTSEDLKTGSESSIYPLGLNIVADSLATRLVPGVRERQSHPRYLTAIAVSNAVCSKFGDETIAKDDVSEPWQIFEWYMVEGLVRRIPKDERDKLGRLPGIDKAEKAVKANVGLSANRYLVMPGVFGFHGVYRVLAKELDIIKGEQLSENGYLLLKTWEKEQGLEGFYNGNSGAGYEVKNRILNAIEDTLSQFPTTVARSSAWSEWDFFKDHLHPKNAGKLERGIIKSALLSGLTDLRKQVIECLIDEKIQKLLHDNVNERLFHEKLYEYGNQEIKDLTRTIMKYEKFASILQDAFFDILYFMSLKTNKLLPKELSKSLKEKNITKKLKELYAEIYLLLQPYNESQRFNEIYSTFSEDTGDEIFVTNLLEHHIKIQGNKPPNGRAPWVQKFDDGGFIIRPAYKRDKGGAHTGDYVHYYRTNSLQSFIKDLKWVD